MGKTGKIGSCGVCVADGRGRFCRVCVADGRGRFVAFASPGSAVNVEEAAAFVAGLRQGTRRVVGGAARFATFAEPFGAFRLGSDAWTGRDFLRVANFFERGGRTRREFGLEAKVGREALRRKDEGVSGDVHLGVPGARKGDINTNINIERVVSFIDLQGTRF